MFVTVNFGNDETLLMNSDSRATMFKDFLVKKLLAANIEQEFFAGKTDIDFKNLELCDNKGQICNMRNISGNQMMSDILTAREVYYPLYFPENPFLLPDGSIPTFKLLWKSTADVDEENRIHDLLMSTLTLSRRSSPPLPKRANSPKKGSASKNKQFSAPKSVTKPMPKAQGKNKRQ